MSKCPICKGQLIHGPESDYFSACIKCGIWMFDGTWDKFDAAIARAREEGEKIILEIDDAARNMQNNKDDLYNLLQLIHTKATAIRNPKES